MKKGFSIVEKVFASALIAFICVSSVGLAANKDRIGSNNIGIKQANETSYHKVNRFVVANDTLSCESNGVCTLETGGGSGGSALKVNTATVTDPDLTDSNDIDFDVATSVITADVNNIDMTATGVGKIDFDTTGATTLSAEGQIGFNPTKQGLTVYSSTGHTLDVGAEVSPYCKNASGVDIVEGEVVYITGTVGATGVYEIAKFIADCSIDGNLVLGIATVDIANGGFGEVTTIGEVNDLNTTGTPEGETWLSDDVLYASATVAGRKTNIEPPAGSCIVIVGAVGRVQSITGSVQTKITYIPRLEELSGVNGTALTEDGQILAWSQTNGYHDFNYNITDYQPIVSGTVGQTLYYSATDTLSATSTLFNDVANNVIKNADVAVTDAGTGTAWDVTDIQVLHYLLEDDAANTTIVDDEGTSNGTLGGGNTEDKSVLAKVLNGINFDGTNDCINTNYTYNLSTDIDVALWYKADTTSNLNRALFGGDTSGDDRFYFYVTGSNVLYIALGNAAAACGTETINDTLWHHYRVKYTASSGVVLVYRDQVQIGTITATSVAANTSKLKVGCMGVTSGNFADGTVDDFRFMVGNMSADDYDGIYNSSDGTQDNLAAGGFQLLTNTLFIGDGTTAWRDANVGTTDTDGNIIAQDILRSGNKLIVDGASTLTGDVNVNGGDFKVDTTNGYVGIGTTVPSVELDVIGDLAVSGSIGIGTTVPTARLELAAGTASAGTAPLKFTSGTLLTTPEAGTIEYDGHYHVTNQGGASYGIVTSNSLKVTTTTVANTTTETEIFTHTFKVDELYEEESISFYMSGLFSNASAADDFTIRLKIGGTTIHTLSRVGGLQTNAGWKVEYNGTIRTEGVSGTFFDWASYQGDGIYPVMTADIVGHTIDTTAQQVFSVTIQWDNAKAGNTFSCTQGKLVFNH